MIRMLMQPDKEIKEPGNHKISVRVKQQFGYIELIIKRKIS